jgi:hypothetical protein
MEVAVKLDQVHRQLIRSPHRYLLAIGIEKALVAPLLSQPDEHRLPYYIETFNANHLSLWKRRGFRIAGGGTITRNGPDFWALLNGRQGS